MKESIFNKKINENKSNPKVVADLVTKRINNGDKFYLNTDGNYGRVIEERV